MRKCNVKYTLAINDESDTENYKGLYEEDEKSKSISFSISKENAVSNTKFVILSPSKLKIIIDGTISYKLYLTPNKTYSTKIEGLGMSIAIKVFCVSFSFIQIDNGYFLELKYEVDFGKEVSVNQINLTVEF